MGSHIKTTVEIPETLMAQARRLAQRRGVTLRTLIEEGLQHIVTSERRRPAFRLRDASFTGEGLHAAFDGVPWERVRDAAYEGHGA
jgi:hypothetical protein